MIKKLAGIVLLSGVTFATLGAGCHNNDNNNDKEKDFSPSRYPRNVQCLNLASTVTLAVRPISVSYFWGSRTANIYYQYDFRILKSSFSFVPGIGFSLERYKFKDNYMVGYDANDELIMIPSG